MRNIHITSNKLGRNGSTDFVNMLPVGRSPVRIRRITKLLNNQPKPINQYLGATWQPMIGPRGTQSFDQKTAMCQSPIGPRHLPRRHSYVQSPTMCHSVIMTCHPTVRSINFHVTRATSSVPHVTLPVVTRVTFGLAQPCAKSAKSA
jgi:hypothetical protein